MELLEAVRDFNLTLEQYVWFRAFKFVLGFYLLIMAFTTVMLISRLLKVSYFTTLMTGQEFPYIKKGTYQSDWAKIVQRLHTQSQNEWKAAVIESSELLNLILSIIRYPGQTLGEKLEGMNDNQFTNINEVRQALKIRNQIVQHPEYELTLEEAKSTVEEFGKALQFFQAI